MKKIEKNIYLTDKIARKASCRRAILSYNTFEIQFLNIFDPMIFCTARFISFSGEFMIFKEGKKCANFLSIIAQKCLMRVSL